YLSKMQKAVQKYHLSLPDKQLACAPINSPEGLEYYQAMCCAANFAWANRQYITYWIREIFENVFRMTADQIGLNLVYDVAHNIAKKEMHRFAGKEMQLCVHRKGATRAFPPDHPDLPAKYQQAGQPVLVPGDMGRYSYCLAGKKEAMENTFGSACHGAGRILSRGAAKKETEGRNISAELKEKNILVKARNRNTLREEFPAAYKDVSEVVKVIEVSNICEKVARMRPLGVIKG
ncbi:MAG: RtcB family protein, partial [Atribacterota bacterium]|nr:RtcB family protein [Atribacterota bacterium]